MLRALNTAATGMAAQEKNVSTISNNIANTNTTSYKKGRAEFEDLLYETVKEAGARSSNDSQYNVGLQLGSGSRITAVSKDFTAGSPEITDNPLDLMIAGEGFFGVTMSGGQVGFTRDGSFSVDSQGNIVTSNGGRLFPGLTVPPGTKSINISKDGQVDVYFQDQVEPQNVGTIPVFLFMNNEGLRSEGGNIYRATTASGNPQQMIAGQNNAGKIEQGMLESSNVNIMNEMTSLIKAQRAYEMNSKVMGIADQILQTTNNIR